MTTLLLMANSALVTYLLTRQPETIHSCVFKDQQGMPVAPERLSQLNQLIANLEAEVARAKERAEKPCCNFTAP